MGLGNLGQGMCSHICTQTPTHRVCIPLLAQTPTRAHTQPQTHSSQEPWWCGEGRDRVDIQGQAPAFRGWTWLGVAHVVPPGLCQPTLCGHTAPHHATNSHSGAPCTAQALAVATAAGHKAASDSSSWDVKSPREVWSAGNINWEWERPLVLT